LDQPPFEKLLIANRGEIAVRIQRTCRELGIDTVAVYSEADRDALHVRYANQAVCLGGSSPTDSYLRGERILEAARATGAQAVHPGFGFLAENAEFARAVEDAGLAFVGPPASAMEVMGDKLASRAAMIAAGVPVVPGTDAVADAEAAEEAAAGIGYPVMLKASAGGGGKGIRVVRDGDAMRSAFTTASGEAQAAFGDGRMYIEKFLERPRHVEIQVLGDAHGKLVHIGERECSIQRRHQKLIEETPSPVIDEATRERMGEAAVAAARAVDYRSAGTVEFLWSQGEFYFLEMNTRIQVEHAITEMCYGVDLIEQMIRIAAGGRLELPQPMRPRGHSIEVRLNAEDPDHGFRPSLGTIDSLRLPGGPGVRVDSGAYGGMEITPHYDSMIAKLVVHGGDREQARRRMVRALQELHVGGVRTSAGLALRVLRTEAFRSGEYDTGFLETWMDSGESSAREFADDLAEVAALAAVLYRQQEPLRRPPQQASGDRLSPWVQAGRRAQHGRDA
jgi:acetyl-CoA carboxylase biotin carboxylase subunit